MSTDTSTLTKFAARFLLVAFVTSGIFPVIGAIARIALPLAPAAWVGVAGWLAVATYVTRIATRR